MSARTSTGLAVITAARLRVYRGNEKVRLRKGTPDEDADMRSPARGLAALQYARDSPERASLPRATPAHPRSGAAGRIRRSRRLLVTTNTELNAIAAAAISGLRKPSAASGMAAVL